MNWKMRSILMAFCLFILLGAFVSKKPDKSDFDAAKELIVMRKIAHQVLQSAGDSTSQILPVNQLSAGEFQLQFAGSFSFKPDSLVNIIDKLIKTYKLPSDYIVNVLESSTDKVVFGYAILGAAQNNIVPCRGRNQPVMQYRINIKFREKEVFATKYLYLTGIGILGLGLFMVGFQEYRKRKHLNQLSEGEKGIPEKTTIQIGQYQFYPEEQFLVFNNEKIDLTITESKLLNIFATNSNQIIDRNRLQKLWEDEGVIVGRSLDMFISKLRKKLENDAGIKLVNIHGKGYKLEINQDTV